MLRSKFICAIYILIGVSAGLTFLYSNRSFSLISDDRFTVSYMPNVAGVCVYEQITPNTMKCNATTVNTIISNMISEDFFYIASDMSEGHILDILLTNGEEEYRILYNRRTRDYMCFSKPFLKNYVPTTYIHE